MISRYRPTEYNLYIHAYRIYVNELYYFDPVLAAACSNYTSYINHLQDKVMSAAQEDICKYDYQQDGPNLTTWRSKDIPDELPPNEWTGIATELIVSHL